MKFRTIVIAIWILIVVPTMAYGLFMDSETSTGNSFSATTLDTQLTPELTSPVLNITYELPFPSTSFMLTNTGQLTTNNVLTIVEVSNPTFAFLINVEVKLDDTTTIYNGPLNLLNISTSYLTQIVGQTNKLGFTFSMLETDYTSTPQESVTFKLKNHAWQDTLPFGSGFFDNEYMEITLSNPSEIEDD